MVAKKREMRARQDAACIRLVGILLIEADQLPGLLIRQRRQQDRLDDAEHGGRAADAETERGDDHRRETGASAELPERVAQILAALLDPAEAVQLVDILPREGGIAESAARGDVRLVWRHALAEKALGEQVEVGIDFQPRLLVEAAAGQHEEEPRQPCAKPGPPIAHRLQCRPGVRFSFGHRT